MSVYGPIFDSGALARACAATLKTWAAAYVAETESKAGMARGTLPVPTHFRTVSDLEVPIAETHLPAVRVVSPGLARPPIRDADGRHMAWWHLHVGVVAKGRNNTPAADEPGRHVRLYAAALRALVLQRLCRDTPAVGVTWTGESYDQGDLTKVRSVALAVLEFEALVRDVVDASGGPTSPPLDPTVPPGDVPLAETVHITIDPKEH